MFRLLLSLLLLVLFVTKSCCGFTTIIVPPGHSSIDAPPPPRCRRGRLLVETKLKKKLVIANSSSKKHKKNSQSSSNLYMTTTTSTFEKAKKARSLVGRIPWHKFRVNQEQAHDILRACQHESHIVDITLIVVFGLLMKPLLRFLYNNNSGKGDDNNTRRRKKKFESTKRYPIVDNLKQVARLSFCFYILDMMEIALEVLGLDNPKVDLSNITSRIVVAYWLFRRIRFYKRQFLEQTVTTYAVFENKKQKRGKIQVWDKILDGFLSLILFLFWLDVLNVPMTKGLSSVFALGGAGTLAFTLACQDLAKRVTSGLALSTSEIFFEGEEIILGDGTEGIVNRIGWLSTEIRGYDERITIIPNTDIVDQRVSNLSRVNRCQVYQTLRFSYDDIEKIPQLVQDIKQEIQTLCPKLIINGDCPFRVHWTEYEDDHIKVVVDCRFNDIVQTEDEFWDNRQQVLEAIHKAMDKNQVQYAIPTSVSIEFSGDDKKQNNNNNNNNNAERNKKNVN